MRTKVKITKQRMKQDRFTTFMLQTREWLLENWQVIAIVAAVVILVIAGGVYFINMQASKKVEGANQLTRAMAELRRQNNQVAILELSNILDEYGGLTAAKAAFYLANAHYESRNYDEAITYYKRHIDDYHIDRLTAASAIAGIAACLENKQQFLEAGDKYYEAIEYYADGPAAADYYLGAVRCYSLGGDKERTEKALAELKEKYPNTEYARTAIMLAMPLEIR
ncbi:MAG: tetratricopeptide repeat protein [Candidatus Zixiibacteriota bacterium]|nr:MAG: tetratricopeptide repeat protein [candidate division Zixibacteria bacterium]